ncbi:MAG TPA: SMI1/KNR4 family protein [Puia sp.]|nr:SMI1/KNR4 family protein [Puia sp.]
MNPTSTYSLISEVLSRYFDEKLKESPYVLYERVKDIPRRMRDHARDPEDKDDDEYGCWKPIPSTVTDKEFRHLERLLRHPLPASYRYFLQQWHFMELGLDQHSLLFFPSRPGRLVRGHRGILKKYYPGEVDRGLLPFANYGDWGVACFDARRPAAGNDYPVVLLDHEDGYTNPVSYAANFEDVFRRTSDGFIWIGVGGWVRDPNLHHDNHSFIH